jgi:hypothetical protein
VKKSILIKENATQKENGALNSAIDEIFPPLMTDVTSFSRSLRAA